MASNPKDLNTWIILIDDIDSHHSQTLRREEI